MSKEDREQGQKDGASGAHRASDTGFPPFWGPTSDEDYDAGYDHAAGQKDAAEGNSNRADNLFFNRPRNEDAYRKGYEGGDD